MTFGLLITHDHGATWHWMCEDAVGYGGTYDPDYVYAETGSIFATTFDGLRVMRDGCTFNLLDTTVNFFSAITEAPDHKLYFAAAQTEAPMVPGNSGIYTSTDDGTTLSTPVSPGMPGDWWSSIEVAPGNPRRLYATGYRFTQGTKLIFSFRSDDGGATYQPMSTTGLTLMPNSKLEIVGIAATNADLVYARVTLEDNVMSDALYRSGDAGATWTRILGKPAKITALVRANGDLIAGTASEGLARSSDLGATWTALTTGPHANCLMENAAREVWACTQELGSQSQPGDGFTIMKSTADLATWTGVLKFADIKAPVACATGTIQRDVCDCNANEMLGWPGLCAQLGCTAESADTRCALAEVPVVMPETGHGCCDTGAAGGPGALVLGAGVALVLATRRQRR